ncbi:type II toxin-antitoxin system RelE/ParE family toxin [Gloeobacter violaceus]|uniref:Glr1691 protein n=1 Tax=Gloeobacter violaceus (strain ATCC 29082 / PCC 7421) TaxID=251221 RepID=Q7NJZ0_GLOVI|nr:type II toxin-antitoxin system RelE/ParE family toxin [Gloeobacter violaceus]BAC89632.1 glr1691 [Gloeobacter violaceus PCC 7421]
MSLPVLFTPAAVSELIEAEDWHEAQMPGLGVQFRIALDRAVASIAEQPHRFPVVFQDVVRRALLRRFPYGLYFCIEPDADLAASFCGFGCGDRRPVRATCLIPALR